MRIRLGHSPDPDDAFLFWALAAGRVPTRGFAFEQVTEDAGTLDDWAADGRLEVTALSPGAYPFVQDRYALLPRGVSMEGGPGPVVVGRRRLTLDELRRTEIAIPAHRPTAALVLRMAIGDFASRELPFDRVAAEVAAGRAEAGLLVHEDDPARSAGLTTCLDLGEWWLLETGLPLPRAVTAVRRDVPRLPELAAVLRESVDTGLANREEAMRYALGGKGAAAWVVDWHVDELTCDYGDEGPQAVEELLRRGGELGAFPQPVRVDFAA
jgi:1,4-dihydroxy-6-naphthoate synthase